MQNTHDAVVAVVAAWIEAFNRRDVLAVRALYAEGATLWGTYSTALLSSDTDLQAYFEAATQMDPPLVATLGSHAVQLLGQTAMVAGAYTFQKGRQSLAARFSMALRHQGRRWQIVHHHSSLVPAAPQG